VDECLLKKPCQHECRNTIGSFHCLCPPGYKLLPNGRSCKGGSPLLLQYKLLTLPSGIPLNHNVVRLSAFSESGILQERTSFTILEQESVTGMVGRVFDIKDEAGRGIIFTRRVLDRPGLVRLKVQATTISEQGRITYQSIFIIYISISAYPY
ncbi:hypothetical protein GOODEAATRI_014796, partial [Goodea atripinnis]